MNRLSVLSSRWVLGGTIVVLTLGFSTVSGQDQKPFGALLKPSKDFSRTMEKKFDGLIRGERIPEAEAAEIIDIAAQHFAYRLTESDKHDRFGTMSQLVDDVDYQLGQFQAQRAKKGARNAEAEHQFCQQLARRLKEVLEKNSNSTIICVNGGRMLTLLAATGCEDATGPLLDLLKDDSQNDGVKYIAVQGLKEWFKLGDEPEPVTMKNKEREAESITALVKTVERKGPPAGPREEVEGFRLLRREALRALAPARRPVLVEKDKSVKVCPAVTLLRVLADPKACVPPPRLDEQVEAAVGLARMQIRGVPDYQPDYAAEHIGRFIVHFADAYQQAKTDGKDTAEPWRVHAARLSDAMQAMKEETSKAAVVKEADVRTYVATMVAQAEPVVQAIEQGKFGPAGELIGWLNANPSKNIGLFRDVPESAVQGTGGGQPGVEKKEPDKDK